MVENFEAILRTKISEHFTWGEAIWCPKWGIYALPDTNTQQNIIRTADKLESIRSIFGGRPLVITSWWRPKAYNTEIGGATLSAHIQGLACDFRVLNQDPQITRDKLLEHLDRLDIRMELQPDELEPHQDWIHIDLYKPANGQRTFNPGVKHLRNNYTSIEE